MSEKNSPLLDQLEAEFSADFEKNAQSKVLHNVFGKIWAVDKLLTTENMPELNKMPEALRNLVLAGLESMLLIISERGIFMLNPGKEDMRAFYRITEESADSISVFAVPTNGKTAKELTISFTENHMIMDNKTAGSPKIYFKVADSSQLNENQANAIQQRLKEAALHFMGEMTNALKETFKVEKK